MSKKLTLLTITLVGIGLLVSCGGTKNLASDLTPEEEMNKAFKYCNYERAISYAKKIYIRKGDNKALQVLAESYLYLENSDSAEYFFSKLADAGQKVDENLMAKMHVQNRDWAKATESYKNAGNEAGQKYCQLMQKGGLNCSMGVARNNAGFVPKCYVFDASGSIDPTRTDLEFGWKTGDGKELKGVTQEYCYQKPGTYKVEFFVYDPITNKTEVPKYHDEAAGIANPTTIEVSEGQKVVLPNGDHNKVGRAIKLELTETNDGSNYLWKMGDNSVYIGSSIEHIYKTAGSFNLKVYELNQQDEIVSCFAREVVISGEIRWKSE